VTRWALRRLRRDDGVTLVEMAVVMLLLSAILAFTMGSVASFQRAATGGVRRIENLNEARILMQVITKDIRTAAKLSASSSPFILADDNELIFLANLNLSQDDPAYSQCPKRIRLYVDGVDKLIESVTEPDLGGTPPDNCTWPATPTRNRLVGRYIANDPSEPIFTYYYADPDSEVGALLPFTATQTPLSVGDSVLVKAVGIELAIRKDTSLTVAHTTIQNRVRLPNVYYNPPPSPSP
jgi:prepilin-type N-terminal cleavage/methylation domain-containing protein